MRRMSRTLRQIKRIGHQGSAAADQRHGSGRTGCWKSSICGRELPTIRRLSGKTRPIVSVSGAESGSALLPGIAAHYGRKCFGSFAATLIANAVNMVFESVLC